MPPRRTNAPYEPIYYPALPERWRRRLALFLRFCEGINVPSKNLGMVSLILMATQRYAIEELFWGLSQGIHDFVILKARQLGISTVLWALDLFWLIRFSGIQAMYITDDEPNKEVHRDIISEMYKSLPARLSRGPWRMNNRLQMTWDDQPPAEKGKRGWLASRMQWAFANKKNEGQLARSRGINYVHGTELDGWTDREGVASLSASLADQHPLRLYLWEGTGQGFGLLYSMWEQSQHSLTSRPIFIGFWRNPEYTLSRDNRALWAAYGAPRPTGEELEWGAEVKRQFKVHVGREQLGWWRWHLAEGKGINGDQAKMMQEFPWLPDQAFQAAGTAFISPRALLAVRTALRHAPLPEYFRYEWGQHFDTNEEPLVAVPKEAATLTVWEPPQREHVYVLAADPSFGSGPGADRYAATLWRCHPDAMVQAAEYQTPLGAMYQFAWVIAHLAGAYRIDSDDYLIMEIGGPGRAVHEEIMRMAEYHFGMTKRNDDLAQVLGGIQHFLYRRLDSISQTAAWHFNTTQENRIQIFEQLRDCVERGAMVIRSGLRLEDLRERGGEDGRMPGLADELATLRREESGRVEAGGVAKDDLAFTAALAAHCWLQNVVPDIEDRIAPLHPPHDEPGSQGERMLRGFLRSVEGATAVAEAVRHGIRGGAPGRGRR